MEELKQYVIRPIVKNKFSGHSSFGKTTTIIGGAQLSMSGVYKTGLSSADEAHFESELSLPKGTLNKKNAAFWGDMEIRLKNDKITIFSIVTPYDELKFRVLQEHDWIAKTEHHVAGQPSAKFYIYDPEAASKIEATKMEFEFSAMEAMTASTIEEKREYLKVFGKSGVGEMSETMVKTELFKFMKSDPKEFLRLVQSKDTPTKALILSLIEAGILKKKGTYFYNGDDLLGSSTDEVVSYFTDIKNQAVKLALTNKLKPKKTKAE